MSSIKIGPFTYNVLQVKQNRLLLSWTESETGITKERWFVLNGSLASKVISYEISKTLLGKVA